MDEKEIHRVAKEFLDAWNSQDVERVVSCYTEDVFYVDPNTRGEIRDSEALSRYLAKLFVPWRMNWALREAFPLEGRRGFAALWHASIKRADGEETVEIDGMDLIMMRGDQVERNEVYFDRAALLPLMESDE